MTLVAYSRFKFLWGAVDAETGADAPNYDATNTQGNVGSTISARRALLRWNRLTISEDVLQTHLDIVNITGGVPDDTWTTGDYTTCESAIDAIWTALAARMPTTYRFDEIRWYRLGPAATPPEPAVRTVTRNVAGSGSGTILPAQVAASVTWKTGLRKHWGRSYFPGPTNGYYDANGMYATSFVDTLAGAANTYVTTLAANDFYPVVYDKTRSRLLTVEKVQVDNVPDIIRRRRAKHNIYRKSFP